ncbi:hypothetical protein [Variovorax sp. LjRoot84]|uniref:hypothetical protein n=1 Tax=Variovorax sp. LjRoot84 TaxID=3342340 RepID=UPI003F516252
MSQNWKFETLSIHTHSPDPSTRGGAADLYAGIEADAPVVTHCDGGGRAALAAWAALKQASKMCRPTT